MHECLDVRVSKTSILTAAGKMLNSLFFYLSFIYAVTDFSILNKESVITCWVKQTIDIGKYKSSFYANIVQSLLSLRKAV